MAGAAGYLPKDQICYKPVREDRFRSTKRRLQLRRVTPWLNRIFRPSSRQS